MYTYKQDISQIQEMLSAFLKNKYIDTAQLKKTDPIIKKSEEDQFKILNCSLPLDVQRTIFGAVRNINITVKSMKQKLKTAAARHENPTTAEKAFEVMESLNNLVSCISSYENGSRNGNLNEIDDYSRILYRKAKAFGFSEDMNTQLKEAGVTGPQIESFIDRFDNNLAQELDIEEEVHSNSEDSS
jgi:hypothetical protein